MEIQPVSGTRGDVPVCRQAGKWLSVALLVISQILALSLWFSASVVVVNLQVNSQFDATHAVLFTSLVQAGFVVGTLASAGFGLADRIDPRRFFSASALIAGAANALMLLIDPASPVTLVLRFATGVCMAGIYPVGLRIAATWARGDAGLLVGLLVGALTLGSALPHLAHALGGLDWRFTLAATSLAALSASGMILFAGIGPNVASPVRFRPGCTFRIWTTPTLRLVLLGYLGHMWELYAMWTWIAAFLLASFRLHAGAAEAELYARLGTFAVIGAGAAGCLLGGLISDRKGRTTVAIGAMAVSGSCALVTGYLFAAPPWLVMAVCLVWGISIVADSAQFSASLVELSERFLVGTMLTVQTALGFLLTLFNIHLLPWVVARGGWGLAFALLAPGPFLGIWAMARLRAHPEAERLAAGRCR
jgi:MFS family permease